MFNKKSILLTDFGAPWVLCSLTVCGAPGFNSNLIQQDVMVDKHKNRGRSFNMKMLGSFTVCGALGLDSN